LAGPLGRVAGADGDEGGAAPAGKGVFCLMCKYLEYVYEEHVQSIKGQFEECL